MGSLPRPPQACLWYRLSGCMYLSGIYRAYSQLSLLPVFEPGVSVGTLSYRDRITSQNSFKEHRSRENNVAIWALCA